MTTPDYFSELTAWRKFSTRDQGRLLVSANHPIPWLSADPGPAVCIADPSVPGVAIQLTHHGCPELHCYCGYYAYKLREHASVHEQGQILARVLVWGRIVEHTRGYRAERLKIAEIFVPSDYPSVDALATRYGVPITRDAGVPAWTSVPQNALSPLSQFQSQLQNQHLTVSSLQNLQLYQNQLGLHQMSQSHYMQQLNAASAVPGFVSLRHPPSFVQLAREARKKPTLRERMMRSWQARIIPCRCRGVEIGR